MAFDRHTLIGGLLVLIVLVAMIAGISIVGGPGEARRQKEDNARLRALKGTAYALACYKKIKGRLPEDLSTIGKEAESGTIDLAEPDNCWRADYQVDPITGDPFSFRYENGTVTQICAVFATDYERSSRRRYTSDNVLPNLYKTRNTTGEHCFDLNLDLKETASFESSLSPFEA